MPRSGRLAGLDLLPSPDAVRVRLAEIMTERRILQQLQRTIHSAHEAKQRLKALAEDAGIRTAVESRRA